MNIGYPGFIGCARSKAMGRDLTTRETITERLHKRACINFGVDPPAKCRRYTLGNGYQDEASCLFDLILLLPED